MRVDTIPTVSRQVDDWLGLDRPSQNRRQDVPDGPVDRLAWRAAEAAASAASRPPSLRSKAVGIFLAALVFVGLGMGIGFGVGGLVGMGIGAGVGLSVAIALGLLILLKGH